jgi:hypothetical protein
VPELNEKVSSFVKLREILPELKKIMDLSTIQEKVTLLESKREALVQLLEQPNLGSLRLDVNQALDEMDDLIKEFKQTFPPSSSDRP